jgi:TonB family protein
MSLLPRVLPLFAQSNSTAPNTQDASEELSGKPVVYHSGGDVTAPVILYKLNPEYSEEARRAKRQGTVVLYLEVDPGRPRNIKVLRRLRHGLDQKATEALKKWRFRPGYKDGKPVTVACTVEVNFRLLKDP